MYANRFMYHRISLVSKCSVTDMILSGQTVNQILNPMTLALDTAQSNISQDRPGYNDVYIMKLSLVVNNLLVLKIWYNESYFDYTSLIVTLTMKIAMQIFI